MEFFQSIKYHLSMYLMHQMIIQKKDLHCSLKNSINPQLAVCQALKGIITSPTKQEVVKSIRT